MQHLSSKKQNKKTTTDIKDPSALNVINLSFSVSPFIPSFFPSVDCQIFPRFVILLIVVFMFLFVYFHSLFCRACFHWFSVRFVLWSVCTVFRWWSSAHTNRTAVFPMYFSVKATKQDVCWPLPCHHQKWIVRFRNCSISLRPWPPSKDTS